MSALKGKNLYFWLELSDLCDQEAHIGIIQHATLIICILLPDLCDQEVQTFFSGVLDDKWRYHRSITEKNNEGTTVCTQ